MRYALAEWVLITGVERGLRQVKPPLRAVELHCRCDCLGFTLHTAPMAVSPLREMPLPDGLLFYDRVHGGKQAGHH